MSKDNHNNREVDLTARTPVEEVAGRLQQIVDGLKAGTIDVQHGDDTLTMRPGEALEFRFRARQKDRDESLRLDLNWQRATSPNGFSELQISDEAEDNGSSKSESSSSKSGSSKSKSRSKSGKKTSKSK